MGKNSWLTAVKRAFRSPTKDSEKKSCRRKVDNQPGVDDDEKKLERRKWLFKRHSNSTDNPHPAKAAVQIVTPPARTTPPAVKLHLSATLIQTAFRGYLARRALVALKGIVKLQAIIRGQNVRNQATLTMRCMQTLLRVQARMRDQRARLSHDVGLGRRSMVAETTHLWDSDYTKTNDVRHRKSRSRDGSSMTDDWRHCPRTLEELEAVLKARKEAAPLLHQNSLAFAFSQQNKIMGSHGYATDGEESSKLYNRANWLEQWMAGRQQPWESSRPSADYRQADSAIKTKTTSIDSLRTSSAGAWKSRYQSPVPQSSPRGRSQSPETPRHSTRTTKSPQIRPASPGRLREEKYPSAANTPSLRSGSSTRHVSSATSVPNYMAATQSAKARIRWQSAPRQRPPTPETERGLHGSARKRLSYQTPEPHSVNLGYGCHNLRSPSFKSVQEGCVGMEAQSCYTESVGGEEISPSCSTTDLRKWLR